MVVAREVAEAGGCASEHFGKVLLGGGPGGATIWVRNLGVDNSDAAKTRGGPPEFHVTGDGYEGLKAEG